MLTFTRRRFLGVVGAAALAGCSSTGQTTQGEDKDAPSTARSTGGQAEENLSAERRTRTTGESSTQAAIPTADQRLPLPMDPDALSQEARSGGPGKDGIQSIDDPSFVPADDIGFLDPGDPVFGVVMNGEIRAYPQSILVNHEIVNDQLGDQPVAVTYCPLTGTAMGFERDETTLGVSGKLINNNLVMYDRDGERWWPQIPATSIPGAWNGDPSIESLREFRLHWTTFEQWHSQYPETEVLSRNTGFALNYGNDPYGAYNPPRGYYDNRNTLFPRLNPNDRHHPKEVFLGARTPEGAVAFRKAALADAGHMEGVLGDTSVVAVYDSRLDTGYVYLNPEERGLSVAESRVTMENGTEHEPGKLPLERVYAFDAMWFAWSGFYPESTVHV